MTTSTHLPPPGDPHAPGRAATGPGRRLATFLTAMLLVLAGLATAPTPPAAAAPLFTVLSPEPPPAWLGQPYTHIFTGDPAGATWTVSPPGGAPCRPKARP